MNYASRNRGRNSEMVMLHGEGGTEARFQCISLVNTPNANMADHSVGARDEYESEASEASVFCFVNASSEKSCFVDGLVCVMSLCLRVFEFLNATRRE